MVLNLCKKKANSELAMLRTHNRSDSQYPTGLHPVTVNLNDLQSEGKTLC